MITNRTLDEMTRTGAILAKAIAYAYYVADSHNRAKLEIAFASLFKRYQ